MTRRGALVKIAVKSCFSGVRHPNYRLPDGRNRAKNEQAREFRRNYPTR